MWQVSECYGGFGGKNMYNVLQCDSSVLWQYIYYFVCDYSENLNYILNVYFNRDVVLG